MVMFYLVARTAYSGRTRNKQTNEREGLVLNWKLLRSITIVMKPLVFAVQDNMRRHPKADGFTGSSSVTLEELEYDLVVSIAPYPELEGCVITATFRSKSNADDPISFLDTQEAQEALVVRLVELATSHEGGRESWTDEGLRTYRSDAVGCVVLPPAASSS